MVLQLKSQVNQHIWPSGSEKLLESWPSKIPKELVKDLHESFVYGLGKQLGAQATKNAWYLRVLFMLMEGLVKGIGTALGFFVIILLIVYIMPSNVQRKLLAPFAMRLGGGVTRSDED